MMLLLFRERTDAVHEVQRFLKIFKSIRLLEIIVIVAAQFPIVAELFQHCFGIVALHRRYAALTRHALALR
jgi:hypothetical protein